MSLHKSGAQKRKEKKRADSERRGLQTLFQVGMRKKQHNVEIYRLQKMKILKKGRVLVAVVKKRADMETKWELIEKQLPGHAQCHGHRY